MSVTGRDIRNQLSDAETRLSPAGGLPILYLSRSLGPRYAKGAAAELDAYIRLSEKLYGGGS